MIIIARNQLRAFFAPMKASGYKKACIPGMQAWNLIT
jgi:hypothetical protein